MENVRENSRQDTRKLHIWWVMASSLKASKGMGGQGHMLWDGICPFRILALNSNGYMDGKLSQQRPLCGSRCFEAEELCFYLPTYVRVYWFSVYSFMSFSFIFFLWNITPSNPLCVHSTCKSRKRTFLHRCKILFKVKHLSCSEHLPYM